MTRQAVIVAVLLSQIVVASPQVAQAETNGVVVHGVRARGAVVTPVIPYTSFADYLNVDVPERYNGYEKEWLGREDMAFERLAFWLARDEHRARTVKKRMQRQLTSAIRFTNGSSKSAHRNAFKSLVAATQSTPQQLEMMRVSVSTSTGKELPSERRYSAIRSNGAGATG